MKAIPRSIKILVAALAICSLNARAGEWLDQTYLHADVGAAFVQDLTLRSSTGSHHSSATAKFDTAIRGDMAIGYNINDVWAVELESGVIWDSLDNKPLRGGFSFPGSGDDELYQIPILLNAIYKFPLKNSWTPYLGLGAGGVVSTLKTLVLGDALTSARRLSDTDFTFAYQASAGVKYKISSHMEVDLGYKFFGTLDHTWNGGDGFTVKSDEIFTHAVLASFTWRF